MLRYLPIILLSWLWVTGDARAEVFVLPPPVHDGTDGAQVSMRIVEIVSGALGSQGTVITPEKAVEYFPPAERKWCGMGECVERFRTAANATAAVVVRVYRLGEGAGPATSFQIGLQTSPGLEYTDGAVLEATTKLEFQAEKVLQEVLRKYRRGPGPHLSVTGAPAGAVVFVDGEQKGTLPAFITLGSGPHRVRVEAVGFAPKTQFVQLASATSFEELKFRLEPAPFEDTNAIAKRSKPDPLGDRPALLTLKQRAAVGLMTLGGALFVASTGFTVAAVAANDGEGCLDSSLFCRRADGVPRQQKIGIGAALSVVGAGSVIVGAVMFKRGKESAQVGLSMDRSSAVLAVRGGF